MILVKPRTGSSIHYLRPCQVILLQYCIHVMLLLYIVPEAGVGYVNMVGMLTGKVTAMEICNGMLCLACNSTETPLVALRLDDLSKARLVPLREGKSVMQWVSGILGTSQPTCVACMVNVPVAGACNVLAVLYTSGLLSMWEPSSGRHLCQMGVGATTQMQQEGSAKPFTVSGLCVPSICNAAKTAL